MASSSEEAPGRVLLVGSTGLEHRLAGTISGSGSPFIPSSPTGAASPVLPWRLDTKYYTASALLEARHVDQCGDLQLDTYEAVVLVFDTEAQPSFAAVQRWYETAGGADVDLGVKLAVGLLAGGSGVSGSGGARPRWLQAAEEWCKEQLVELVEAGAAEEEGEVAAAAAAAASSREGGASGWRRVREALEAHMWPGMQLKPNPRHGAASAAAEISSVEPAGAPQLEQQAIRAADVEDAVPPGNGVHASGGSSPDSLSFAELLGASGQAAAASAAADRGEEEVEVDEMEQLFAQVASHRAQLAQLPDAQRREAAAAMVMQLMTAMGLEDDGEEEEEDSEEEDEDAAA